MLPTPPVLFVVFNRPDLARQTFAAIRKAKPTQLFLAADGPRATREDDQALCEACRDLANQVDWDCNVQTLFRDENLGCRRSMSSAITWFFTHVEAGIIIEDDCVPELSFFQFCAELLERYRDDDKVMAVSGDNAHLDETDYKPTTSYNFSAIPFFWGWATWRRAWDAYDDSMSAWSTDEKKGQVLSTFNTKYDVEYWTQEFDMAANGVLDTWGYRWVLSCISRGGLAAVPYHNLCSNVGFDDRATHTTNTESKEQAREMTPLEFPLIHPPAIERDQVAEQLMFDEKFEARARLQRQRNNRSVPRRIYRKLKRILSSD